MEKFVLTATMMTIALMLTGCPAANFTYDSGARSLTVMINMPEKTSSKTVSIDQAFPGIKLLGNIAKIGFAWIDEAGNWKGEEQFAFTGFPQTASLTKWPSWNYPTLRIKPFVVDKAGKTYPADMRVWIGVANNQPIGSDNGIALDGLAWEIQLDFSVVTDPEIIGQFSTSENWSKTVIKDEMAYCVSFYNGLRVLDISDPMAPIQVGSYANSTACNYYDVACAGSRGYLTTYDGLIILDLSRSKPIKLGQIVNVTISSVVIDPDDANIIYVFAREINTGITKFCSFNCSNPSAPTVVGQLTLPERFHGTNAMALKQNTLYLGGMYQTGSSGIGVLMTIDVTDPANLKFMSYAPIGNSWQISDVKLAGNRAYVADSSFGTLGVIDITNPSKIQSISNTMIDRDLWSIDVHGYWLFAACRAGGLKAYNISNELKPVLVTTETDYNATGVTVNDDLVYVASGFGGDGLIIIDPATPAK